MFGSGDVTMVRPLNSLGIGDRLQVLGDAEVVRPLHDGADDDARAARFARHLRHGRVADREVRRSAEHGGEGLGVAAGGGDVHLQAVLLEDAGMHADIEVDVAEVVNRLAEVDFLEVRSGGGRRMEHRRHGGDSGRENHPRHPRFEGVDNLH